MNRVPCLLPSVLIPFSLCLFSHKNLVFVLRLMAGVLIGGRGKIEDLRKLFSTGIA